MNTDTIKPRGRRASQISHENNEANPQSPDETSGPTRTRIHMNTARIVRFDFADNVSQFVVLHNGKVTAIFGYSQDAHTFAFLPNTMGNYDGFPSWFRQNTDKAQNVLISKSPDDDVIASQTDRFVSEKFITEFLDRKETRERLALAAKDASNSDYGKAGDFQPDNIT